MGELGEPPQSSGGEETGGRKWKSSLASPVLSAPLTDALLPGLSFVANHRPSVKASLPFVSGLLWRTEGLPHALTHWPSFWLFILVLLCPRGASLQVPHPLLPLDLSISLTPSDPSPCFSGVCLSMFPCGVASYQARLPPASPKSLDLFANQFNICEAEIIIVTYFTGGLMRINSLMSTEVFEDGTRYLRAKRYY